MLVNALVHRDYLINASIRLFIFDNRIEIISPGHLPNHLTLERMRLGISHIRNPILLSYVAKGMLPYKGLGSGIKRVLTNWPDIDFIDDREACQFTVVVHRKKEPDIQKTSEKTSGKTSGKILGAIEQNPTITIPELAALLGITSRSVERNLAKLQQAGQVRRVGPAKGGYWELNGL